MMRLLSKLIGILLQLAKRDQKVKTDVVHRSKILGNNLKYFSFTFCNIKFISFLVFREGYSEFSCKVKKSCISSIHLKSFFNELTKASQYDIIISEMRSFQPLLFRSDLIFTSKISPSSTSTTTYLHA